jgi:hypothetical protein
MLPVSKLRRTAATLLDRVREYPLERRYDADLAGAMALSELGYADTGREGYIRSRFLPTARAIRRLGLGPDDVVADLGAGKGLGVLVAGEYPVRRVIGVELVPQLADIARANVERNRARVRAADVEIVTGDVLSWQVPDDLTIVYLYSPFFGDVFGKVLDRLLESLDRHPRPLRLVYTYPREHEQLLATGRARLLDLTSALWPTRLGWWREPHVIATYGVGDGPFPRSPLLPPRRRALRAWNVPAPAVEWPP